LNDLIQSFNLLNLYSTIISNYDSNNKKLFSYSSAYSTNALTTKGDNEKDGKVSIYKNGLASPLPVNITTGNLNGDRLTIKTNYSVDVNAAKALAKTTGLNAYFAKEGVTIFANNSYDKIISAAIDLSNDKLGGILERYTA
jgi:hypothetical protein